MSTLVEIYESVHVDMHSRHKVSCQFAVFMSNTHMQHEFSHSHWQTSMQVV
jgi:hypothetical protein